VLGLVVAGGDSDEKPALIMGASFCFAVFLILGIFGAFHAYFTPSDMSQSDSWNSLPSAAPTLAPIEIPIPTLNNSTNATNHLFITMNKHIRASNLKVGGHYKGYEIAALCVFIIAAGFFVVLGLYVAGGEWPDSDEKLATVVGASVCFAIFFILVIFGALHAYFSPSSVKRSQAWSIFPTAAPSSPPSPSPTPVPSISLTPAPSCNQEYEVKKWSLSPYFFHEECLHSSHCAQTFDGIYILDYLKSFLHTL
jgi:hypothetical protein